jgi:hypothetical protein
MPAACSNFPDWNYFNGSGLKKSWLRGLDLNQRPSGYEPDELPGCSTPRSRAGIIANRNLQGKLFQNGQTP